MPVQSSPLIATITAGLVLAFAFGLLAHRLRVPPLAGYLIAGIAVGPFTPGYVADAEIAGELSEIGIILLMFGVGLHFSPKDLGSVARIAVPAAIGQIVIATLLGMAAGLWFGWDLQAGFVYGLALSVASTVVVVRALQERRSSETEKGRISLGWLIVEDLVMVLALVVLPEFAAAEKADSAAGIPWQSLLVAVGKIAAFIILMLVVGRKVIPQLMHHTAHTGSRELFRLAVYATAIGVAFAAANLFGASFALGAFVAGIVLGESKLSQRAADEAIPLRDAFAVLFFVSVGMLFDPRILLDRPVAVLATLAIIMVFRTMVSYLVVRTFRYPAEMALTIAAGRAQIGEFSFILAGLGVSLGMLPGEGRDLILSGAIISILLNPAMLLLSDRLIQRLPERHAAAVRAEQPPEQAAPATAQAPADPEPAGQAEEPTALSGHEIVFGHGRVGAKVAAGLLGQGRAVVVADIDSELADAARRAGAVTFVGNAADPQILRLANPAAAARLFVTLPDPFEAGQVVEQFRAVNPDADIVARAHSQEAVAHLAGLGANVVIMGEDEIARRMLERALAPAAVARASETQ